MQLTFNFPLEMEWNKCNLLAIAMEFILTMKYLLFVYSNLKNDCFPHSENTM